MPASREIAIMFVQLQHSLINDSPMNVGQRFFSVGEQLGMDRFCDSISGRGREDIV